MMRKEVITMSILCIFMIPFIPFFAELFIEGYVTKKKYIQSLKLTLFLFIILNIPLFLYLISE
ncbi:hypothetical protein E4N82_09090 [Treponema denticola]|uniref:hypothetical protein n=1 Tax=Treponema denticola TaxID=158 RepID=UPI0040380543